MSDRVSAKLKELVDNFDNQRIPLSVKQRSVLEKKFRYYGAQGVIDYVDDYIFDGEFILVAEDGENLKSQRNNICNYVTGKFWVNNHAHIIRAKGSNNTKYLYYALNLINFRNYVTGSAQPKLTKDNLGEIVLHVHNGEEQKKIADVISALDEKIELNNRINAELEAMAKTLYDYWFVQFDFPDANGKPYKTSGGKMVYNPTLKREMPEGWSDAILGQLITLGRGVTYGKDDVLEKNSKVAIGVLRATNITGNSVDIDDLVYVPASLVNTSHKINAFETIIVMSSGSKEHVGKNGIYYFNDPIGFGAFCSKIVPVEGIRSFVNTFLQSSWFRAYIKYQCLGTNINNLTGDHINQCPIVLPTKSLIAKFEEKTSGIYKKISVTAVENQNLRILRDWLLPMLMNGQVTVK